MTILHLAHRADWDAALETGEYRKSSREETLDEADFIHASYADQVARVAKLFYSDDDQELCVLVMDEDLIRAEGVRVLDEDAGDGELFPHIYGPIKPHWVKQVLPAGFDAQGTFQY